MLLKKSKATLSNNKPSTDPIAKLALSSHSGESSLLYELKPNKDTLIWYLSLLEDCFRYMLYSNIS